MTAYRPYPVLSDLTSPDSSSPDTDAAPSAPYPSKPSAKDRDKEGPVKNACLSCRTKKAKCDGAQPVCGQCQKKDLECVYVKSRRGGARKKREVAPPSALQQFLKKLDGLIGLPDFSDRTSREESEELDDPTNVVRQFESRDEILRCYYNDVHPFLPVMPTRQYMSSVLPTLLPDSPFLLAAQMIMVLVPHPLDPAPKSSSSKRLRNAASESLAKQAIALIESMASRGERSIEAVQALTMMSVWEWGKSGDLEANKLRSRQAIQLAMDMGLNELDLYAPSSSVTGRQIEGEDWRKDMARRTWWLSYVYQLNSAIVSGSEPVMSADDTRIHVFFPICSLDDSAWPNWIEANRMCSRVIGLVNQVYYSPTSAWTVWGSPPTDISEDTRQDMKQQMREVDAEVVRLIREAEKSAVIELVPGGEEEVVRNQQLSARLGLAVVHIHVHRQQAFPEVSLFSKRICGLPKAPDHLHPALDVDAHDTAPQQSSYTNGSGSSSATNGTSDYMTSEFASALTFPVDPTPVYNPAAASSSASSSNFLPELWQPSTYPTDIPQPWFATPHGASALYAPLMSEPVHFPWPPLEPNPPASIRSIHSSSPSSISQNGGERRTSTGSTNSFAIKMHKAWGVGKDDKAEGSGSGGGKDKRRASSGKIEGFKDAEAADGQIFPPGISLARCATAAHTIVRLEVLHRSAVMAMWDGPPKWLPFCSCGLVTGAYAFLLLALAVQAENSFETSTAAAEARRDEVDALLTNVKVIVAGLEAYGVMWDGIGVMAGEVKAALEAATRLPYEVRAQIQSAEATPPLNGEDEWGPDDYLELAADEDVGGEMGMGMGLGLGAGAGAYDTNFHMAPTEVGGGVLAGAPQYQYTNGTAGAVWQ